MNVLIVEDEPAIAETIRYALQTEGILSQWVSTGQEALEILQQQTIHCMILDIGLPDISGFDVCRTVRSQSSLPIIFLTSRSSEIDQVLGLELGADDYVIKPFSPRVLTARVRSKLRQGNGHERTTSCNGLQQDAVGQRILLNDQDLGLSRYEYRMLSLLLAHPGRVYSRDQLMERVWEEPDKSFDRTVDTHIKTIRQKIKCIDASSDPIKTHRGLGYSYQESPAA